MKILGTFGKGVPGAVAFNVSRAGSDNCDDACPHKGAACYFERLQLVYTAVERSLAARESEPLWRLCGMAMVDLQALERQGKAIPWFRFSVGGSLPHPSALAQADRDALRRLVNWLTERNIPIHLPIEASADNAKLAGYRALLGDACAVRFSAPDVDAFLGADGAASVVVGKGVARSLRIAAAQAVARARTLFSGRKCIVCPAISHGWAVRYAGMAPNARAKCGGCTACADRNVDVVYPLH